MMFTTRPFALALILATAVVLAGCKDEAQAEGGDQEAASANAARSVEYYKTHFAERLNTEAKCRREPEITDTEMCLNVRRAANAIKAELGMKPEYPEVGDGSE